MFVLSFVDKLNDSVSSKSVTNEVEIVGVSNSIQELKRSVEEKVNWEMNEFNVCIGHSEDDESEQYYTIVKVS